MSKPVAIITGASRGIGKATALKFAAQGYCLTLVADNEKELQEVKEQIGSDEEVLLLYGNLEDLDFARKVIDRTYETWKRIDVLVNNAAWRTLETLRTITVDQWEKTLRICLTVPAFLAKWATGYMEKNAHAGVIVNISSVMSERAGGTSPAYVACKGALLSLTNEMAALYGPSGIRVVAVSPGNVSTQMSQDFTNEAGQNISQQLVAHVEGLTPLRRSASPEEIAQAVFWLCSKEASFISGTSLVVDGGFSHNFNAYQFKKLQFPKEF